MTILETVKFPVGHCPDCGPNVLLATALNADDALIHVCVHCDTPLPEGAATRQLGARSLKLQGYDVAGETEKRGCGDGSTGGCGGSCGT